MKNYLVIGASTGIGASIASQLSTEGQQVFGTYNKNEKSDAEISFHHLNVEEEELNLDFLPEVLDGVVYCPGSINLKPFHRIKPADFIADYNLQVVGAVKVLQTVLPRLKKSAAPSVVLFSTVAVQNGFTFHSQVSSSKGAVEGLVRALSAEFAPKIRVNGIAPSITDTPLASRILGSDEKKEANAQRHPLKKIGQPSDLAEMAVFLLSEKSSWMTGQILHVDGGMSVIRN